MTHVSTPRPTACGVADITPEFALVVSRVIGAEPLTRVLARHDIHATASGFILGSGSVMGAERLADVIDELDGSATRKREAAFLPPEVVAQGANTLTWYAPSMRRPMFFNLQGTSQALETIWPALLLQARGSSLRCAALADSVRPYADTPVYRAPLMNHVHDQGMCAGSVTMPPRAQIAQMSAFEHALFESNFSHLNGVASVLRDAEGAPMPQDNAAHVDFYAALGASSATTFPSDRLIPADESVAAFIAAGERAA